MVMIGPGPGSRRDRVLAFLPLRCAAFRRREGAASRGRTRAPFARYLKAEEVRTQITAGLDFVCYALS